MDIVNVLANAKKKTIVRILILFAIDMLLVGYTIASSVFVILSDGKLSAGYAVIPSAFVFAASSILCLYVNKLYHKMHQR